MKLRDHPLMSYRGIPNWPPVWTRTERQVVKTLKGEVGLLTYVHSNPMVSSKCYLVIEYEDETYVGTLIFDTHDFCKLVSQLLTFNLRRPIREIGDLDLSHLL
jgi:hypothetical protein